MTSMIISIWCRRRRVKIINVMDASSLADRKSKIEKEKLLVENLLPY